MNNAINFYWVPPARCLPGSWAWLRWDMHKGWLDPYTEIRELGIRICGLEISWDEARGSTYYGRKV